MNAYWQAIDAAALQLRTAKTNAEVFAILGACADLPEHSGRAFWGGDGDDMLGALYAAGWHPHRYQAPYYWVLRSPDRSEFLSYTEGDVDAGDNPSCR